MKVLVGFKELQFTIRISSLNCEEVPRMPSITYTSSTLILYLIKVRGSRVLVECLKTNHVVNEVIDSVQISIVKIQLLVIRFILTVGLVTTIKIIIIPRIIVFPEGSTFSLFNVQNKNNSDN